jgi:hypothetical protein
MYKMWDAEFGAVCDTQSSVLNEQAVPDYKQCIDLCTASAECDAAVMVPASAANNGANTSFSHVAGDAVCRLHSTCTILNPVSFAANDVSFFNTTFLKPYAPHPPGITPETVKWRSKTAVVMSSFSKPFSWLDGLDDPKHRLPDDLLDLVIYHKGNLSIPTQSRRLRFWQPMRNFGENGGSREPVVYLQFALDFRDNLPEMIIFSQDDCASGLCPWYRMLSNMLPPRDSVSSAELSPENQALIDGLREPRSAYVDSFINGTVTRDNCFCQIITEDFFNPQKYYWYKWMNFLDAEFLSLPHNESSSDTVIWPVSANFAVARENILRHPPKLYEHVRTLTRVEKKWHDSKCIMWAHTMERLWFHLFFGGAPNDTHPPVRAEQDDGVGAPSIDLDLSLTHILGPVTLATRQGHAHGPHYMDPQFSWETDLPHPTFTEAQMRHYKQSMELYGFSA